MGGGWEGQTNICPQNRTQPLCKARVSDNVLRLLVLAAVVGKEAEIQFAIECPGQRCSLNPGSLRIYPVLDPLQPRLTFSRPIQGFVFTAEG